MDFHLRIHGKCRLKIRSAQDFSSHRSLRGSDGFFYCILLSRQGHEKGDSGKGDEAC